MTHTIRQAGPPTTHILSFFPSVDKARRAAVEEELVAAFVKEFFVPEEKGDESTECVFLFDLNPKGRK